MKKEVQEKNNIKSLMECLEMLPEETLEELYEKALAVVGDKKQNKISKEKKKEYICGNLLAQYMASLLFLNKEQLKNLEEVINGNRTKEISKVLIEENYIFPIGDTYYVPSELKEAFERMNSKEIANGKINILITYYMIANGLLEVNKLIELVKESGFEITKKKLEELVKNNNYKIKNNIVYLNEMAEDLNEDNNLLELKKLNEYKVVELNEALAMLMLIDQASSSDLIEKFFKKKTKNKEELSSISDIIFNLVLLDNETEKMVEDVLEEFNINLNEDEEDKLFEIIEGLGHTLPSWTLNGYTPHEIFCDEYDDEYDYDFNDLSDDEKKETYILNYTLINGMISIDKLVELLTNEHNLKTSKKEIIKLVKESETDSELCIIDNYVCCTKFIKEDFYWILSMKKLDTYKVIEDMDHLIDELEENDFEFESICYDYNLDEETINQLRSTMQLGVLDEDVLMMMFEQTKKSIPLKRQHALYKELKGVIKNTRMWILNGYTPLELNNNVKTEKIGRNEPCPCGSGKKYKQCCGK